MRVNDYINNSDYTKTEISQILGITRMALYNKMQDVSPFTIHEAIMLKEVLNIPDDDFIYAFMEK